MAARTTHAPQEARRCGTIAPLTFKRVYVLRYGRRCRAALARFSTDLVSQALVALCWGFPRLQLVLLVYENLGGVELPFEGHLCCCAVPAWGRRGCRRSLSAAAAAAPRQPGPHPLVSTERRSNVVQQAARPLPAATADRRLAGRARRAAHAAAHAAARSSREAEGSWHEPGPFRAAVVECPALDGARRPAHRDAHWPARACAPARQVGSSAGGRRRHGAGISASASHRLGEQH